MEAAHYFGLDAEAWYERSAEARARMVAHVLIKAVRDAYVMEQVSGKAKDPKDLNDYEKMRMAMLARMGMQRGGSGERE